MRNFWRNRPFYAAFICGILLTAFDLTAFFACSAVIGLVLWSDADPSDKIPLAIFLLFAACLCLGAIVVTMPTLTRRYREGHKHAKSAAELDRIYTASASELADEIAGFEAERADFLAQIEEHQAKIDTLNKKVNDLHLDEEIQLRKQALKKLCEE